MADNIAQDRVEVFRTDGEVSQPESGWTYQAGSDEEMVYVPFEGMYPNKGGRMQSPWFTLPKRDKRGSYCCLQFTAKTAEHCYWWLDYLDKDGQRIPDCNSAVYPGEDYRQYNQVVYVPSAVRQVQIAFVSKGKVEAKDVRFATATLDDALQWCDELYGTLPPLQFTAPHDSTALIPKTVAAMKNGTPWRMVMLGHSITNDTFNSLFQALIQRDFPKSNFNVLPSVRGSTTCSYYREPANFAKYVLDKKPDLLLILGSGSCEDLTSVVEQTREQIGCEILVVSMPLASDWRKNEHPPTNWRDLMEAPDEGKYLNYIPSRDCSKKLNIAFWDMTSPCNDYIASAPDLNYNRDYVHNNDTGKQIIGRVLREYFLTAKQ